MRGVPAATLQSQQDDFATAMRTAAAIDSAASTSRKPTSPAEYPDPQSAGWQSTSAQAAASFFTALQPAQPNLQTWLDNWFGPSARPSSSVRESSESNSFSEPGQSSPAQDVEPSNPQSDGPDMQPAEFLAPDEIAESYEEIQRWLAANPGVEHGIAGASGALPERNLFAGIGTSVTRDAGTIAMPRFGETPGMAAIAGNVLQPLRGINEGYTTLGVL